jgi:hypothetical protein
MKYKRHCIMKYILGKNVRSSGNSIIHRWILMLLAGIFKGKASAAAQVMLV